MTWLVVAESFIYWVTPFVGMCLAVCVYIAILAAHRSIGILKDQRERLIESLPVQLRIDLISNRSRKHSMENLVTHVIFPLLFLVWAVALVFALI